MKKRTSKLIKPFVMIAATAAVLFGAVTPALAQENKNTTNSGKTLRILFTQDLHSNELPFTVRDDKGNNKTVGGYAKLKTAIDDNKSDTMVVVDGGDYSHGSLFNAIFKSKGSDLALLGKMGFDATTLGNHEFDDGLKSLAASIEASAAGQKLPVIVSSNIQYGESEDSKALKAVMEKHGTNIQILEKNGVKIGLFGLMGKQASSSVIDGGDVTFADQTEIARQCVSALKDQGVDVIICLSHCGTSSDKSKSEDEQLAEQVEGINVIISSHTHRPLKETIIGANNTVIVSTGCYGEYLGLLDYQIDQKSVKETKLIPIDDKLKENEAIKSQITAYEKNVQDEYLDLYGVKFNDIVARSNKNFETRDQMVGTYHNSDLGAFVTDAFREVVGKDVKDENKPIGWMISGCIRDTIYKGDISLYNTYGMLSIGSGADGTAGSSIIKTYLKGSDIRKLVEADLVAGPILPVGQFMFSGIRYQYDMYRLPLNRATVVEVENNDGGYEPLDNNKMYPIVTTRYSLKLFESFTKNLKWLISLNYMDKNGTSFNTVDDGVVHDQTGKEVKDWEALMVYMKSFSSDNSGHPVIPASYNTVKEVKKQSTGGISTYFTNPSVYGLIEYAGIGALGLLLIFIIYRIATHGKRKEKRTNRSNNRRGKF